MTERFSEAEAARRLGISKGTLVRERLAGRIRPIRIGARIIHYTPAILEEFEEQCRNGQDKSATTGSANDAAPATGAAHGSTPPLDKHDAKALALQIFKKAS